MTHGRLYWIWLFAFSVALVRAAPSFFKTSAQVDCTTSGAGWLGSSYYPCYCIARDVNNRTVVVSIDSGKQLVAHTFGGSTDVSLNASLAWSFPVVLWAAGDATTLRALDCWEGTVALVYNNSLRLQNIYFGKDDIRVLNFFVPPNSLGLAFTAVHVCRDCVYPRVYLLSDNPHPVVTVVAHRGYDHCARALNQSLGFTCSDEPVFGDYLVGPFVRFCCGERYFPYWSGNAPFRFEFQTYTFGNSTCDAPFPGMSLLRLPYSSSLSPDGTYLALAFHTSVSGVFTGYRTCTGEFTRDAADPALAYVQGALGTWTWRIVTDAVQNVVQGTGIGFAFAFTQLSRTAVWLVIKETAPSASTDRSPEARVHCLAALLPSGSMSSNVVRGVSFFPNPFDASVLFAAPSGCWTDREGTRVLFAASNVHTPTWVDVPLNVHTYLPNASAIFPAKEVGWITSGGSRNVPDGVTVVGSFLGNTPNNNVVTAAQQSPHSRDVWFVNLAKGTQRGLGVVFLDTVNTPAPTANPTAAPSARPSAPPTLHPSPVPSAPPTARPSAAPSAAPSAIPSAAPSSAPSAAPSSAPSTAPSAAPSSAPSSAPSGAPSSAPSEEPSSAPSSAPSALPTAGPTVAAGQPTPDPTASPTAAPTTAQPTAAPTTAPTVAPSSSPTRTPTASPTASPTALPTASPTLAPTTVAPVVCNNASAYGLGVRFVNESRTCGDSSGGACTSPLNFTCADETLDWGTVRCGAFVRRCTGSEFAQRCPNSSATAPGAAAACQWLCPLDDSAACVAYGNTTCGRGPVDAAVATAPSAHCTGTCGPGTESCVGAVPPVGNCVCARNLHDTAGTSGYPCPGQGLLTTACSATETLTYCGSEYTRACRKRTYMFHPTVATDVALYLDFTRAASPDASVLLSYFAPQITTAPPQPQISAEGNVVTLVPECLCTDQSNDTRVGTWVEERAAWRSVLPQLADPYLSVSPIEGPYPGAYSDFLRRRFSHCSASYLPAVGVWGAAGGSPHATAAGLCNGAGRVDSTRANGCDNFWLSVEWARSALEVRSSVFLRERFDTTVFPPVSRGYIARFAENDWVYHSHVLLDMYSGNVTEYGYAASVAALATWQSVHGTTSKEGLRYVILRATPWDCERDYIVRHCGGVYNAGPSFPSPGFERCRDPRLAVNVTWASTGASLVRVRHPVLQCLDQHPSAVICAGLGCVQIVGTARPHFPSASNCSSTETQCACPPALTGRGCTVRRCAATDPCAPAFVGTDCSTDNATCVLPLGHTGRAGCVNGWFHWFNHSCVCDASWTLNASTGACTVPLCTDASLHARCLAAGGTCTAPNTCTACPFGRWGSDCTGVRNVTTGYEGGYNGSEPRFYRSCVNGREGRNAAGDPICACDEGWGGETCALPLCPVVDGQICAGQGLCRRPNPSTPYACQRPAVSGTCVRAGCTSSDALQGGTGLPALNTSVDGCACQLRVQDYCTKPGGTSPCSGVLDGNGCSVCRARPRTGTNGLVEELFCDCAAARTAEVGRIGRYCDSSTCSAPGSNLVCSGKGACTNSSTCVCHTRSAVGVIAELGVGPFCAYDATPCATRIGGIVVICNSESGANPCVFINNSFACNCTNGMSSSSTCTAPPTPQPTPVPTGTPTAAPVTPPPSAAPTSRPTVFVGQPTPHPTTRPTLGPTAPPPSAAPSMAPTAAPTPNASSVVNGTLCAGYCAFGTCLFNPANASFPTCACPFPSVYAYNDVLRDCVNDVCVNDTVAAANRSVCVCRDPTWIQISSTTCRAPLECARANNTVCGPRHPVDAQSAEARCLDGRCVCTGLYANATALSNTTCVFRCSGEHTASLAANGTCVCDPEWSGDALCLTSTCNSSTVFLNGACVALGPTPTPTLRPTPAPSSAPSPFPTPNPTHNASLGDDAAPAENLSDGSASTLALSQAAIIAVAVGGAALLGGLTAFLVYWFVFRTAATAAVAAAAPVAAPPSLPPHPVLNLT